MKRSLALFTRRLSDLLRGGVSLSRALEILGRVPSSKSMGTFVSKLLEAVEGGESFSSALARHSFVPTAYAGMVQLGENSGKLDETLLNIAFYLESEQKTKNQFLTALIYPALLFLTATGVCGFLVMVVIPRMETLFVDLGGPLPWPTRVVMAMATFVRLGWFPLFVGAGVLLGCFHKYSLRVRRLKIFQKFISPFLMERWFEAMAFLLKSGLPVPEALVLSRDVFGEGAFSGSINEVIQRIMEGATVAHALTALPALSPMAHEMLVVAEESGQLESTFLNLTSQLRWENERARKIAFSFLEPIFVVFMAGVVGFVALAMLLPIFEMGRVVQ